MALSDDIRENFDTAGVAFSYGLACLGSLTAVVLMDCRRQVLNPRHQRLLLVAAAVALGGCGTWAMHFMGMTAMTLTDETGRVYPMSFEPIGTVGSLLAAVVFVYLGLEVASCDQYFGKDVEERVAVLQKHLVDKDVKNVRTQGGRALIEHEALYAELQWLLAGGGLAACGIGIMHYEGMNAMRCNLQREWHLGMVALSVVIAVTAGSAAFWILFRVLEWKPHLTYLRLAAALIMGVAVSGMHYSGMHAAIYSHWPASLPPEVPGGDAAVITKWAVGAEVVYCVMCIFLVYTHNRTDERKRAREVDKMYLSLTAVSTELVPTSGAGAHSPTHSTTLTRQEGVTEAERERALHFVSQALRFALAHNSRRRDADVDAVEQDMMRVLRAGATSSIAQPRLSTSLRGSTRKSDVKQGDMPKTDARLSDARMSDARKSDAGLSDARSSDVRRSHTGSRDSGFGSNRSTLVSDAQSSDARLSTATVSDVRMSATKGRSSQPTSAIVLTNSFNSFSKEVHAATSTSRSKVHPISPQEEQQEEGTSKHRASQSISPPAIDTEAGLSSLAHTGSPTSPPLAYRTSRAGSPSRRGSSLADSPLARLLNLPPTAKTHRPHRPSKGSSGWSSGGGLSDNGHMSSSNWSSGRVSDVADEV